MSIARVSRRVLLALLPVMAAATPAASAADDGQAAEMRRLLERFVARVDAAADYSLLMSKQQRTGSDLAPEETLLIKQRRQPDCRYMKWVGDQNRDREAILCPGRYNGEMQVHQPGLLGFTLSLAPTNPLIARGSLRRIDQSGLFNLAATLRAAAQATPASPEPPTLAVRAIDGQDSLCLHRDGPGSGDVVLPYTVGATELCLDRSNAMPTLAQFWDTRQQLMEHYRFREVRLGIGLTDADFDTRNPGYHF